MNIFICTKPLQIMICMLLNNNDKNSQLYIANHFDDSDRVAVAPQLKFYFGEVKWFKSRNKAILAATKEKPDKLYIDSDVGFKPLLFSTILKLLSKKTEIHVYEEGIGPYRENIIASTTKKNAYKLIGAGWYFGGASTTKHIHLFDPQTYEYKFPESKHKVITISENLFEMVQQHTNKLIEIFCPNFKIEDKIRTSKAITLYITDWSIDEEIIKKLEEKNDILIKPHPNIKSAKIQGVAQKYPRCAFVPSALPAEVLISILLKEFNSIEIFHNNSSCMQYIRSEKITAKSLAPKEIPKRAL